jgi:hypothetical protein
VQADATAERNTYAGRNLCLVQEFSGLSLDLGLCTHIINCFWIEPLTDGLERGVGIFIELRF